MRDIFDFAELLGYILRTLGALIFGLGAGWLAMDSIRSELKSWQLTTAAYLGLLAAFVLLGHWVEGGATLGAFGLGAGVALLIWGLRRNGDSEES